MTTYKNIRVYEYGTMKVEVHKYLEKFSTCWLWGYVVWDKEREIGHKRGLWTRPYAKRVAKSYGAEIEISKNI